MDKPFTDRVAELRPLERRLVEATVLAGRPLPLTAAVALGDWTESELLDAGDRLASAGLLAQSAAGFIAADGSEPLLENMGDMRRSATVGALADAFRKSGAGPEVFGPYLAAAARWEEALEPLAAAGLAAVEHHHLAEAVPLLERALEAADNTESDDRNLVARLHLARAQAYRLMGRSDEAVADAAEAGRHAEGSLLTDALEWQSRLADDQQRPQDADGFLAVAQLTAAADPGRLGKLHSLRARTLGRIGFPVEAEVSHEKADALLAEHGTAEDRFSAKYDEAWVAFDQGRAEDAADRFAALAEQLSEHQVAELADVEVWLARALFAAGKPAQAEELRRRAMARAEEIEALGPVFLGHMALAEGAGTYGAWEESLRGADDMLAVVLSHLPAWENAARYLRARALNGLGRHSEAREEIDAALAATPDGMNGWRWRNRCRALKWRIDAEDGGKWDDLAPADLTEELLAARFYSQAAELLSDRVKYEKDPELGRSAAALALRFGQRAEAARALSTTKLWDEPEGLATAHAVRNITVPDEWADAWSRAPGVAQARALPEVADVTEVATAIQADLDAAFERAGLEVDDRRLSPAQRRSAGLRIKEPRQPRRRRRLTTLASAAALVLIAGTAGAVGAVIFNDPGTVIIERVVPAPPEPGEPEPTTPEETRLEIPDLTGFGAAQWSFRGETDRQGLNGDRDGKSTRSGVDDLAGYWWKFATNQPVDASPVVRGQSIMVGSANATFYSISALDGQPLWLDDTDAPISSAATFSFAALGEGGENESVVFVASEAGTVYAYRTRTGVRLWDRSTGSKMTAPLLAAEGRVFAPSEDGFVYAFETGPPGNLSWRFPAEGDGVGSFITAPLFNEGIVYAATREGTLFALDAATGEEVCRRDLGTEITASPVLSRSLVYVGTAGTISMVRTGTCGLADQRLFGQFLPMNASPLVDGNDVYIADGSSIVKLDLQTNLFDWRFPTDAPISSSPALAGGILYFGANDGRVYAVDARTGDERWSFQTEGEVRSSPAIADGAIYVGSRDGFVYAIGGTSSEE